MSYATKIEGLIAERDKLRADYESACKVVADMHAAAMGGVVGPAAGVVEDVAALREDAKRFRWLAPRMLAADFDYGGEGTQALVFEMPPGFSASADCSATIDAAMALGG